MSQNLKYILTFIAVLGFLAVCWYGITVYDKHETRKYILTELEITNTRAIDSLKVKIYADSLKAAGLMAQKETEKLTRNNYASNKNKKDREIYNAPADRNREYNINFLKSFEPKYR